MAKATMVEIARLSGVSRATVSAVLNGKAGVSEKTRKRVLAAIRQNDLQHRLMARSLMGHFGHMFAVVVPDINNPFYIEMIMGFLDELKPGDHHMICRPTDGSHEDEVRTLETLAGYELGGYVLAATLRGESNEHIRQVIERGRPLVLIGDVPGLETHTICFDNRGGSKGATDYLLERGHRRMVCLGGLTTSQSSKERALGFVESLLEHDIPFDDSMIVWTDAGSRSGYEKALEVLRSPNRPTALVCFNDAVAIGVYRAAHELGLHIPSDISVVGFDDIEMAALLGPPLTTVSMFAHDTGRAAAQILTEALQQSRNKGEYSRKLIKTKLVERDSVAPPCSA